MSSASQPSLSHLSFPKQELGSVGPIVSHFGYCRAYISLFVGIRDFVS